MALMLLQTPPLAAALERGKNRFNLLRLVAALAVIASHSVAIKYGHVHEPLEDVTPYALGAHAVNVFFVLSGVLVAMSFERSTRLADYIAARVLRVMPGLAAVTLVLAFAVGPLLTDLPLAAYLASAETWAYVPRALLLFDGDARLPGLFSGQTANDEANAPIWTLAYEVAAYAAIAIAGSFGLLRSRKGMIAAALLALALYAALEGWRERPDQPDILDFSLRAFILYVLGCGGYLWREHLRFDLVGALVLVGLVYWANDTDFDRLAWLVATAYWTLWLGTLGINAIDRNFERADLSYGTYLYGWPAGQILVQVLPGILLGHLIILSMVLALAAAAVSWTLVEKPALARRKAAGDALFSLLRR